VSDCRTTTNWTTPATILNLAANATMAAGLAAAQFHCTSCGNSDKKVMVFFSNSSATTPVGSLFWSAGTLTSSSVWNFFGKSQTSGGGDSTAVDAVGSKYISAVEDTAWSTTNSRVLVTYAEGSANPWILKATVFNAD